MDETVKSSLKFTNKRWFKEETSSASIFRFRNYPDESDGDHNKPKVMRRADEEVNIAPSLFA